MRESQAACEAERGGGVSSSLRCARKNRRVRLPDPAHALSLTSSALVVPPLPSSTRSSSAFNAPLTTAAATISTVALPSLQCLERDAIRTYPKFLKSEHLVLTSCKRRARVRNGAGGEVVVVGDHHRR